MVYFVPLGIKLSRRYGFRETHGAYGTAVLFVEINAPPMNLEGPELIRDLVSLIQQAEADKRYDWSNTDRVVLTTTDSNFEGRNNGVAARAATAS